MDDCELTRTFHSLCAPFISHTVTYTVRVAVELSYTHHWVSGILHTAGRKKMYTTKRREVVDVVDERNEKREQNFSVFFTALFYTKTN